MKTLRKKGSGRVKGSVSFCAIRKLDMMTLMKNIPGNGMILISRKWKDRIAQMGFDTSRARRVKNLNGFTNGLTRK